MTRYCDKCKNKWNNIKCVVCQIYLCPFCPIITLKTIEELENHMHDKHSWYYNTVSGGIG